MEWLTNIDTNTIVLVPTRGLQHSLANLYAKQQIAVGRVAWETPTILVWEDYLDRLWQTNKQRFAEPLVRLSNAQAFLVWQQIILQAKRSTEELTLLNEQQTASVAQRSWKLAHKWQIDLQDVAELEDADSQAFRQWCEAYQHRLQTQNWVDPAQLERLLIDDTANLNGVAERLIFACFDLVTASQRVHISACKQRGILVEQRSLHGSLNGSLHSLMLNESEQTTGCNAQTNPVDETKQHVIYTTPQQELFAVFTAARARLENDPNARIGIVIPTLGEQRSKVEQLARSVLYPDRSPLDNQQQELAYRFSLGDALSEVPYVRAMLTALALLKDRFRYQDLSFLLRCAWWPQQRQHFAETIALDRLLKRSRSTWWTWEEVLEVWQRERSDDVQPSSGATATEPLVFVELFQQLILFRDNLKTANISTEGISAANISSVTASEETSTQPNVNQSNQLKAAHAWQQVFADWLILLGWQENNLDSFHYQVHESWLQTLESFVAYDLVQMPIGLPRALMQLNALCQEKVFMRQAQDEPILISGVLEAIGQPVDYLYLTGMDETYPTPLKPDPFIPSTSLQQQAYPFADKTREFQYEREKMHSLLSGAQQVQVSYARQHKDGDFLPSALFRQHLFKQQEQQKQEQQKTEPTNNFLTEQMDTAAFNKIVSTTTLEEYRDVQGKPCQHSAGIKGGSRVFENQSLCPFKAYIEHRILRVAETEPEFGLDSRDAGTVVHALLDTIWSELGSSSQLLSSDTDIEALITQHTDDYLADPSNGFQYDRQKLLKLERPRLIALLKEWFELEKQQRAMGYSVVGRETKIDSQFGGIPIRLVIDRIDQADSGERLIIDYKTGQVNVADWKGERPKSPQLPLYALALEDTAIDNVKGIAFGKVKRNECELLGVAEVDYLANKVNLPKEGRSVISWQEQLAAWHQSLSELAEQFLDGYAAVDPKNNDSCNYCDLSSVCRVHQLRAQGGLSDVDA